MSQPRSSAVPVVQISATASTNNTNLPFTQFASLTKLNDVGVGVGVTKADGAHDHGHGHAHKSKPSKHATSPAGGVTPDIIRTALQQHSLDALKETIRIASWPVTHASRNTLWSELIALFSTDESVVYCDAVHKLSGSLALPGFASSTHTHAFCLRPAGIQAVYRVLAVVQLNQPQLTSCPMLFSVAAILLHYMSEEATYSALSALLANTPRKIQHRYKSKPPDAVKHNLDWVIQTQRAHDVSTLTLRYLVKKYLPSTFNFIKSVLGEKDAFGFYEDWLWWLLEQLPFDHIVRVFDCYLLEGIKIFFRVSIALIRSFHLRSKDEHTTYSTSIEMCAAMRQHCRTGAAQSAEELLSSSFKLRSFSKAQLLRYYDRFAETINDYRNQRLSRVPDSDFARLTSNRDTLMNFGGGVVPLTVEHTGSLHSNLLSSELLQTIWSWLPERIQLERPLVVFSTAEDGYNLNTLYARVERFEPTILLVRSSGGSLFGAYCSTAWAERDRAPGGSHRRHSGAATFFGTGETFVFTLSPHSRLFRWVGLTGATDMATLNSHRHSSKREKELSHTFQLGLREAISIGGCGRDAALNLDESLTNGTSRHCATFNNQCLAESEDFVCSAVEVIAFERM